MKHLPIGIQANGIRHRADDPPPNPMTAFSMVRDCGLFDYVEKTPSDEEFSIFAAASERTGVPIRCGGWYYTLKRDEFLLKRHLRRAHALGTRIHNVQILTNDATGKPITDQEVADFYQHAAEWGDRIGVDIALEVHVNMWSEDFRRVPRVARLVEDAGLPFRLTLDHSHVIFKMDHPDEQERSGIREDVESGRLELDPFKANNVTGLWVASNWVAHAHARPVIPNNPRNWGYTDEAGNPGRGIQYPFTQPASGEFDGEWLGDRLEPWKEVVRQLLRWHAETVDSPLGQVTTEYIPAPDYGAGCRYSLFGQSQACAAWLRQQWDAAVVAAGNS